MILETLEEIAKKFQVLITLRGENFFIIFSRKVHYKFYRV